MVPGTLQDTLAQTDMKLEEAGVAQGSLEEGGAGLIKKITRRQTLGRIQDWTIPLKISQLDITNTGLRSSHLPVVIPTYTALL